MPDNYCLFLNMWSVRNITIITCLLQLSVSFTSCITSKTLSNAKLDRKNEKVSLINSSFIDSGYLIINFEGNINSSKKQPYHIRVPVDTLVKLFQVGKSLNYYPDSVNAIAYNVNRIYRVLNNKVRNLGYGTGIELNRHTLKKDFYTPADPVAVKGIIINYTDKNNFRYQDTTVSTEQPLRAQHVVFLYYPPREDSVKFNTHFKIDYIAFSIEPSPAKKYGRYALVPLTVTGDIVTGPFQAIGFAFLALTASAMKF